MIGKLWEQLEHHISTGLGVSDISYSSTVYKLVYDIGKGSCSSPILCTLLNHLILTALEEKYDCITLVSVDKSTTSTRSGNSFVDDTTTRMMDINVMKELVPIENKELTSEEDEMVKIMEAIIQFFLDLLQVMGGDLAPEKCVWYLISHQWNRGKPTILANKSTYRSIIMISKATGTISPAKRKSMSQGHRTLGFHLCGDRISRAHKR
jgi:hypothetical protein